MTSVLTNGAARIALQTLRAVQSQIDLGTNRLATGRRVATAADGAAYWAITTTLRADRSMLDSVRSGLTLGVGAADVASAGLSAAVTDLGAMRERLVSAMAEGADRSKLQTEIAALQEKMRANATASVANGTNWLSIDSSANGGDWGRIARFAVGVPRGADGSLSLASERLDIATVALFDASAVHTIAPSVAGTEIIDQIDRLAESINRSSLGSQVYASATSSNARGSGTLRLTVRDPAQTITASYQHGVAAPAAGTSVDHPRDRFGDPLGSYVTILVSNLSAGDVVTFQVSGSAAETFTVTGEGDGLDFSGSNEIHLEIRPFKEKYPAALYDVVVNGAVLASRGVTGLANVTRQTVAAEIARQVQAQYTALYSNLGPRDELLVETGQAYWLTFGVGSSGPKSAIEVTVAPPTGANAAIDIGYGTTPGTMRRTLGSQEPARLAKGLLDTPEFVTSQWRTDLAGLRVPDGYAFVTLAGKGTAFSIAPDSTQEQIGALVAFVDQGIQSVMEVATRMGALRTRLAGQAAFTEILGQIQESAIGALVDANIELESAQLKALQTQQQLGLQSLSIVNGASGAVVALFR